MRVLLLNYEYPPLGGGAGNATKYLLKEFAGKKDLHIDLVTSSVGNFRVEQLHERITGHFLDIIKKGSLHYQSMRDLMLYAWKSYWYAKKLISQKRYDLVHAFFGIPCGVVAMKLGLPYIVSLRGSDVPGYNPRFAILDRFVFTSLSRQVWKRASSVVANSQGLKDLAMKSSPGQPIDVIPNGVDADSFPVRKRFLEDDILRILFVGRLIPRKGVKYLLEAITGMKNVRLTIVGDGPLLAELRKASAGMDVHFTGTLAHDELKKIYSEHDVFVLPSLNEGMSNTVLEAMAAGLPVIVTDIGGTKELIDGNGFVVAKENAEALHSSLQKFLEEPSLMSAMGFKSKEIAKNKGWDTSTSKYFLYYKKII